MIQKALKIGDSVAVTIPKKSLKELGIKAGDKLSVSVDVARKRVVIEQLSVHIDSELVNWTKSFIEKYRPALEALARK